MWGTQLGEFDGDLAGVHRQMQAEPGEEPSAFRGLDRLQSVWLASGGELRLRRRWPIVISAGKMTARTRTL